MSNNQKTSKSKKAKWVSIIIAVAIIILAVVLLSKYGDELVAPSESANESLAASATQQPTSQTAKPTASPLPTENAADEIDYSKLDGPYDVVYVLDGDTIIADIDGDHIKIRLIGIDSPESVHYDESENTAEGDLASDFAKTLLENNQVWLEYDLEEFDQYDRTLAYIYTAEHGMINNYMLLRGYAIVVVYPPNVKYVELFTQSVQEAEENNRGLWGQ